VGTGVSVLGAAGDPTWTGSGSVTMTSTPAPGDCTGNGPAEITLDSSGSSVSGTLDLTLESVAAACSGDFPTGELETAVSGSISGNSLEMVTPEGDSITGQYNGGTLSLTLIPGGASTSVNGVCVEYCTTVYQFTFQGSGDLFGASGFLAFSNLPTEDLVVGGLGTVAGAAALGAAAAAPLPPRGSVGQGPSSSPSTRGFGAKRHRSTPTFAGTWRSNPPYTATPAPPPTLQPPVPMIDPGSVGMPLGGIGAHMGMPDSWPGHPPPTSLTEVSRAGCPWHHCPVHPAMYVSGPGPYDWRGLEWQCPVGPHWVFIGGGGP